MPVPTIKLLSGYEMPLLGLGTWQSKPGEVEKAVEVALNVGYVHIDCAWVYGNQVEIGKVLKKFFSSTHKREDVFITSKVWNTFHSAPACKKHVIEILDQLQLSYIDLMLIHWPVGYEEGGEPFPKRPDSDKMKYSNEDYLNTWKVLEDFVRDGKIRTIGLSNFNHSQIERVIANSTIKPAVLQVELHPYFQQTKLRAFCKEKGIAVTAYSSLGNPGSAFFRKPGDPNILTEPIVKKIAAQHGKTPAQVVLRWAVQQDIIVIPKSTSEARIKENAALFNFQLTDVEMKEINSLERGWRIVDITARDHDHPHFPFLEEY
ncbi:oxidoreductase, aldo/keto reductase family protein [Dictyocaulus viviparus]|uniref:Oxidoreductase, aldo/keto reductase family protein n=1 Tax=Dictyocaulus viviparus TaxID=29172 RepID=A0A0D8XHI8_DICVI|nr:oxidoreductase, aldo/keto reductase family protein [Dictyocaulus viviparus]